MSNFKALITLIIIVLASCSEQPKMDAIKFDSKAWQNGDWQLRGRMVDALIDDSILIGKSKAEVIKLLGNPTASDSNYPLVYVVDIGQKLMGDISPYYLTVLGDSNTLNVVDVWCRD